LSVSAKPTEPDPAQRGWYTIGEAADYLQVSQPTIFRWMREGQLSFYKIGGSTRFTREGLDAVVEKKTGRREAAAAAARCAVCGNSDLLDGRLQGAGKLYFHPDRARFWVWNHSLVETRARVCSACGYIQLHADTGKLSRLRERDEDDDAAGEPQE
jgi:excisionase family DNA binding protein